MSSKLIYSYIFLKNFWKGHSTEFFKLAKLSVELSKRYYDEVIMYTTKESEVIFNKNGIYFDTVKYFTDTSNITEHSYGLPKIKAMIDQKDPYIIIDLDVLLFEKINSHNTITYGYSEVNKISSIDKDYINKYYHQPYKHIEDKINFELEWGVFPSNSLVVVNNPIIVSHAYKEILKLIDNVDFRKPNPLTVQFYEQFLLYNYLLNCKVDMGILYDQNPFHILTSNCETELLISKKFGHMDMYNRIDDSNTILDNIHKIIEL
jgi:hypothetical protein